MKCKICLIRKHPAFMHDENTCNYCAHPDTTKEEKDTVNISKDEEKSVSVWDNAPKWAIAHAYDFTGIGYYYGVQKAKRNGKGRFRPKRVISGFNLPVDLKKNWDKTLVINPNFKAE